MLAAITVVLGGASTADAQIYTWRDDAGKLVLSNRRPGSELRTLAVPGRAAIGAIPAAPASRDRRFDDLITEHARRNGVRVDLVRAVVQVESGFNPDARSPKGAQGLMQLMPDTARGLGVGNPFNPAENIRGGVDYLRFLLDRYGNNEELALAAYNAGPGAVDRYGETIPPYRETRDYVSRIGRIAGRRIATPPQLKIYRVVEVIDGREVARYSDRTK
jgi:soluble lytic murein transglycosylase-like protein